MNQLIAGKFSVALSAVASTLRAVVTILRRVFVAFDAVAGAWLLRLSTDVSSNRNGLQMIRIDATSNAAEMVNGQPFGNWSDEQFVRDAMRRLFKACASTVAMDCIGNGYLAVSGPSDCSSPEPASGIRFGRDVAHKSFGNWYSRFSHVPSFKAHRSGPLSTDMLKRLAPQYISEVTF